MRESLYRAVWRWHFYAGLIVLPMLMWLAATGALYLYKPELERVVYGTWTQRQFTGPPTALAPMLDRVAAQMPGRVTRIERPADPDASWRMTLVRPDGERLTVFVDPAFGQVLGSAAEGGVMETVKRLHSLAITGPIGNALVEIAAGWVILLCLSGFYLWWPRAGQRAIALRGHPRQRLFWRDLHASAGAIVGGVILFLAVTGMPWSGYWGGWLRGAVTASGGGRPAAPGPARGDHADHGSADPALPWSMRHRGHPMGHGGADIGPDRAIAIASARGIESAWSLTPPAEAGAPYLIAAATPRADGARVLYLDAADGRVLLDAPYATFGRGAQAIEWGIAVHQGQQYGEVNRLVMLAGCIGAWLLALTAPILWWKRRRAGRLTPPPRADNRRARRGVAAIMVTVGALFPLTGATMLAALAGEWIWRAIRSRFAT
ncbi:PepSY domain-containing protein [Sphingomonas colocasiae]